MRSQPCNLTRTEPARCVTGGDPARNWMQRLAAGGAALAMLCASSVAHAQCDGDLNADGAVNAVDMSALLQSWGPCSGCEADLNGDGVVSGVDLSRVLIAWGGTCQWYTVIEMAPNPVVVKKPALRQAIAATGLPWRVRDNLSGIEMLLIPPGTFDMGCSESAQWPCYEREHPVHEVTISRAFYIGRFEVKQSQWRGVMGSNPSFHTGADIPSAPNHPVEQVSWLMAQEFLTRTGLRLPTEAEWEYACRAGTTTAYHSMPLRPNGTNADSMLKHIAWYNENSGLKTHPVGQKAANGLGLHDMLGNVNEMLSDWYGETYYASSPSVDPIGPATGHFRSLRGGSFNLLEVPMFLRTSSRSLTLMDSARKDVGFRVARHP